MFELIRVKRGAVLIVNSVVALAYGGALWKHAASPDPSKAPDSPPLAAFSVPFVASASASPGFGGTLMVIDATSDEPRTIPPSRRAASEGSSGPASEK